MKLIQLIGFILATFLLLVILYVDTECNDNSINKNIRNLIWSTKDD